MALKLLLKYKGFREKTIPVQQYFASDQTVAVSSLSTETRKRRTSRVTPKNRQSTLQ